MCKTYNFLKKILEKINNNQVHNQQKKHLQKSLEYKVKTSKATMENICTSWTKPSDPMTKELDKQPTSPNAKTIVEQAKTPNVWVESKMASSRSFCKIRSYLFFIR
jgi:hypothetical protein